MGCIQAHPTSTWCLLHKPPCPQLWECLGPSDFTGPDHARIKPYTIKLANMTAFHNIEQMLPGTATLELRKPLEVCKAGWCQWDRCVPEPNPLECWTVRLLTAH